MRTYLINSLVVLYFLETGLILIIAPWTSFWERNYFVEALPLLRPLLTSHVLRGAVAGVGLVSLAAGAVEMYSMIRGAMERRAARREHTSLLGGAIPPQRLP